MPFKRSAQLLRAAAEDEERSVVEAAARATARKQSPVFVDPLRRLARDATAAVTGLDRFGDPDDRLPHLVCFGVSGVEAEPILLALDQHGVAVHSGSSCSSEALEPSPVLAAMGVDAEHSLRASVGWPSTDADVDAFLAVFPGIVERLRGLRQA